MIEQRVQEPRVNEQRVFEDMNSFEGIHRVEAEDSSGKLRIRVEVSDQWWDEQAVFAFLWSQIDAKDKAANRMMVKRYIRIMPVSDPELVRDVG